MASETTEMLVLRDSNGEYYLLTPDMLERARVPAEERAAIERQIGGDDTTGFQGTTSGGQSGSGTTALPTFTPLGVIPGLKFPSQASNRFD